MKLFRTYQGKGDIAFYAFGRIHLKGEDFIQFHEETTLEHFVKVLDKYNFPRIVPKQELEAMSVRIANMRYNLPKD